MPPLAFLSVLAVSFAGSAQDPALAPTPAMVLDVSRPDLRAQRGRELANLEAEIGAVRKSVREELTDTIANQQLAVLTAQLAWKKAMFDREVRQYAVKEYAEGIFKQDYETLKGEVNLAQDVLDRLKEQGQAAENARPDGARANPLAAMSQTLAVEKAGFELEQAQTEMDVLLRYTKDHTIRKLDLQVSEAEAVEAVKKADFDTQSARLERRQGQSKRLQVRAPEDLVVALLDEVVQQEAEVVKLVREIAVLNGKMVAEPDQADRFVADIGAKREAVRALAETMKVSMLDATEVADKVRQARQRYLRHEQNLIEARSRLGLQPN